MDKALLIQLGGSVVAVALLVAFAAWMGVARATPPLEPGAARALLDVEFPDYRPDAVWVSADGAGVIAREGALALVLYRRGDGYVARHIPWTQAVASSFRDGVVRLDLSDVAAPLARLALQNWPPAPGPDEDRRAA